MVMSKEHTAIVGGRELHEAGRWSHRRAPLRARLRRTRSRSGMQPRCGGEGFAMVTECPRGHASHARGPAFWLMPGLIA